MSSRQGNRRPKRQARRWGTCAGMAAGTVMAAGMITLVIAPTANADTDDELLGQAGADLTQATQVLDSVPAGALDSRETMLVDATVQIQNVTDQFAASSMTVQDGFPAADQTSPLVLDADQQLVQASQELLTADQGFLSAADAGDLTSASGAFEAELPIAEGLLADYSAALDVAFTDLVAGFDPSLLSAF